MAGRSGPLYSALDITHRESPFAMSEITVTLVGGPTALIEFEGLRFLTDPTFDPPGRYETPTIRHEKLSGPALTVDEVGPLDAVLLSHDQHFDNLDQSGRAMLPSVGVTFTTIAGAGRLGGNARGLAPFDTRILEGRNGRRLLVTGTPARHGPVGIEPISGEVTGFALGIDEPGDLVYVTGDTLWFEGTAEVARRFVPKLVILHTGSAEPRGRFRMTMGSEDALEAAHAFPNAALVAVHNEGWIIIKETQDQLVDTFVKFGLADRLTLLERGISRRFPI
jgi:L-ascorbate metabolism protein UlaG (beta-lactamase superfamily)